MADKNGGKVNFQVGFSVDKSGLSELQSSLQKIQKEVSQASTKGTLTEELKQAGLAAKNLEQILNKSWNNSLNQLNLNKFNQSIKDSYGSVSQLRNELQKSGASGTAAFNQLASTVLNTNIQLKQSNKILDNFATTFKNTIRYGISSSLFNRMANEIERAFTYAKRLDTSLNDIRIVTDKSAESMEKFAKQANEASKNLGASTLDYTNAALIYYQQGLSDEETAARAETTVKAANVTGQTGEEVSEQLTAVWNGYKVTAEETELYVDKLAAVAATTAADLEELSVGMSKVASAANAMGVDFDDLNAQIATIVSVTRQAPESVGTALKTIYARLGDLQVDGVDEFGVSLGKVSEQMVQMGIQILDQNGNLRDMTSVIAEVAEKWNGWTEAQRQAAAVAMAGKRQYNNLIALFDNWDMYTDALNTSTEAVGTLQEQQDIYMESTAAHLKALKTETERTYDILFDPDTANNFIDIFSGVLSQFNDLIEGLGGGTNVLLNFGAIATNVFNKQIGQSINQSVNNLRSYIDQIKLAKNQSEWIADIANKDVKSSYNERGISSSYNPDSEAVKVEAKMRAEILEISKNITQEEFNQLAARQQEAGDLERKIEQLYTYKDIFKEQFNDAEIAETELEVWYDSQLRNIQGLKNEYNEIVTVIEAMDDIDNPLTYQEGVESISNQLEAMYQNELLSDEKRLQLAILLNKLNSDNLSIEEKAQLVEDNKILILSSQKTILKEEQQIYDQVYQAGEKRKQIENGIADEYREQSNELQRLNKSQIQSTQQAMKISSIVSKTSSLIQGITALVGALNTGIDESATGAEKANAAFAGTSGVIAGIANYFLPGSGILVQGVLSLIKGVLELTGVWDNFENLLKSTEEKIEDINKKVKEFGTASNSYISVRKQLEDITDEYEKLSEKAGQYDNNIESLTDNERNKYNELKNIILKYNEDALLGYNERGEAILKENQGIQETIDLLKQQYELQRQELYGGENFNDITETKNSIYKDAQKDYQQSLREADYSKDSYQNQFSDLSRGLDDLANLSQERPEVLNEIQRYLNKDLDSILKNKDEISNKLNELASSVDLIEYRDTIKNYQKTFDAIIEEASKNSYENQEKAAKLALDNASALDTSWILNTIKYNNRYNQNYDELVSLAEQSGIEDIDTYIVNYTKGLKLGKDVANYEAAYKEVEEFYNKLYQIFQTNPNLIKNAQKKNESLNEQDFSSYQDYINNLIPSINQYIQENQAEWLQLDEGTQKIILESAFGIIDPTIVDGYVTNIKTQLTEGFDNLKQHIEGLWEDQEVDDKALKSMFGADVSQSDLTYIIENLDETVAKTMSWDEAIKSIQEDLALVQEQTKVSNYLGDVNTALEAMTKNGKLTKNELEGMKESLEALEAEYPSLAAIQDRETTAYYNKLLAIREALEDQSKALAQQKENKLIDQIDEITIKVDSEDADKDIADLQDKLLELCKDDYDILVNIKSDIQSDFDTAVDSMDRMQEMASKIGDDFIVAAKDIEELNDVFPGILANMELLENGSVRLNEGMVQGAMEAAQAEVAANTEKTIKNLSLQAQELEAKRDAAYKIAEIATQLVGHEEQADNRKAELDEALNQLKTDNSEDTAYNQNTDQKDVAETAASAATSMAQSYSQAYKAMTDDVIKWASHNKAALNYGSGLSDYFPETPSYGGSGIQIQASATIVESDKRDLSNFEDYADVGDWKEVADYYNALGDSYNEALNSVAGKIYELEGRNNEVGKALDNVSKGLGSDGKKSGGSSGGSKDKQKKEEELKQLEDEFDRYWEIHKALEQIDRDLKKIDKEQEHLNGPELIASLEEENKLLEQQKERYEQLYQAQQAEAAELRGQLSGMGVAFDESSGAILNYAEAVAAALATYNAAVAAFNAGPQDEAAQKSLEAAEKAYENFKKLMERYDTLYYTEMQDTQEKMEDIWRKEMENKLKAWKTKVDLELDKNKLEQQWDEFMLKAKKDFKKVWDMQGTKEDSAYQVRTGERAKENVMNTIKRQHEVEADMNRMKAGGQSELGFQSIGEARDALKELDETMRENGDTVYEAYQNAWKNYLDGIEQVADQLEMVNSEFERQNEILNFNRQIIELLYGEEAYDLMDHYYEGQYQASINQIASLDMQKKMWEDQLIEVGLMDSKTKTLTVDYKNLTQDQKELYDHWKNAQSQIYDLTLETVKLLQNEYQNAVKAALQPQHDKLEEMKEEWEKIKNHAEKYYDSIESTYEIQKLSAKYDQSIADAKSIKAQEKLKKLQEEELKTLREKKNVNDELLKEEVQYAELKYQAALKEIALEEAQSAKTSMKLTRDEQGNWSYQYIADEDDIATRRQELYDAYNDLYQLASDAIEKNDETIIESWEKHLDNIEKISDKYKGNQEKLDEELEKENNRFYNELNELAEENAIYKDQLMTASAALLKTLYEQDVDAAESMTEKQINLIHDMAENNVNDYSDIEAQVKDSNSEIRQSIDEVMKEARADWSSAAQQIANEWNSNSNKNSIRKATQETYKKIMQANDEYKGKLDLLEETADVKFGEEGIRGDIDRATEATRELRDETEQLCEDGSDYIDELREYVNDLEEAWREVCSAIEDAIDLLREYLSMVGEVESARSYSAGIADYSAPEAPSPSGGSSEKSGGSGPGGGGPTDSYHITTRYQNGTPYNYLVDQNGNYVPNSKGGIEYSVGSSKKDFKEQMEDKGYKVTGLTGMYTGSWNNGSDENNGRLAFLHQKELVLNADDTKNFLAGVNTIRDMVASNGSIEAAVLRAAANMANSLNGMTTPGTIYSGGNTNNSNENVFNITAEFPNANSVDEIREAILSLPNLASQYIHSNLK